MVVRERRCDMFDVKMYVCPVACHREFSERLLVTDLEGEWYLWMGDMGVQALIDVPERLAHWIASHPNMLALDAPIMWFDVSSLPAAPVSAGQSDHAAT
jgi:hypothetical protein